MTLQLETQWPGWSSERTLVLPIPPEVWKPPLAPLELDGLEFEPKDELHVTLVGPALGRQIHETLGERFRTCAVRAAFDALDWRFTRTGELLRLQKTVRLKSGDQYVANSIIELVQMPAMAKFHHALGDLLGRKLTVPPPHVTLYTHGRDRGIGVPSTAKMRAWTRRRVSPDEIVEPMMS
ncbi:hypothetical protein ACFFGH_00825 [Lysobacter korlensis]|uniref:2'-5' RNA ligase n=1 Tax=Lysobacter korlensis TaxID=553636 RepID=A0ABV6RJ53_9GAMM